MKYVVLVILALTMLCGTATTNARSLFEAAYFHSGHMADHWGYWYDCEYDLNDESDPSCLVTEIYLDKPKHHGRWVAFPVEFVMYSGRYASYDRGSCYFTMYVRRTLGGHVHIRHDRGDFSCDEVKPK